VLDISERISTRGEGGLLGLAFHPGFPAKPQAFVSYTAPGSPLESRLSRFTVASDGRFAGEEILLSLDQPYANHNGGWIGFGPDGYLYFGLGDGGSAGDPLNHAQNTRTLFGAMLRLDVDASPAAGKAYAVPKDNVFAAGGPRPGAGAPEIYAWGLRNPWRWSFDRVTGQLWLGDVGQNAWEEIDRIESGGNYGWRCYEGTHTYNTDGCADAGAYAAPVVEYGHDRGCSVTGGYVYRGSAVALLDGVFLYGDFCSGRIWGLADGGAGGPAELLDTPYRIASFGQDNAGGVYVLDLASPGGIYRIVPGAGDAP
jgi:glucose/arabinose dehydrogenase